MRLVLIAALTLTACGDDTSDSGTTADSGTATTGDTGTDTTPTGDNSLVDVAVAAGNFTTLVAALEAADLADTLATGGPYTVIAPTDEAFAALPEGTVDALLADIPTLTDILLYHVVDGEADSTVVSEMSLIPTLQGSDIKVTLDSGVQLNDATVTTADVEADNGLIHVVDSVLLPPGTITDIAAADPQFSTLVTALTVANLADVLSGEGPFTVFAPTNSAFEALPDGTLDALLADIPTLTSILPYHVSGEKLVAADVVGLSEVTTLEGSGAEVIVGADGVTIAGATIVATDIPASNGIIHVIDAVMIP